MSSLGSAQGDKGFSEHVLGETALANPAGERRDYLTPLVVCALALLTVLLVVRTISNLSYPYMLDTGEGTALSAAWRTAVGGNIYAEIDNPPYFFTIYNPVLPYCCGLAYRVFGPSHFAARLVAMLFYAGTALVVYAFVRRETALCSAALVAALFLLVERHLYSRAGYAVTDYPGIFFSVLGLYLWRSGGRLRCAAVVSFALAFWSKQTSVMAAAAAFSALFLEGRRMRSVSLFGLLVLTLGVGTLAGWALWGRGFLVNTLYYAFTGPFDAWESFYRVAITLALYAVPVIGWLFFARRSVRDKRLLLPVLYVFFGLIFALTSGKVGASRSYFFDFAAGLAIVTGLLWAKVRSRVLAGSVTPSLIAVVVLQTFLVGVGALYGLSITGERTQSDLAHDVAVGDAFTHGTGMILYREPGFDVDTPAENVSNDTYKLAQLIRDGILSSEVLVRPVRERVFSMIIMRDREAPWKLFSDELRAEVTANYDVLYETCGEAFLVPKGQSRPED